MLSLAGSPGNRAVCFVAIKTFPRHWLNSAVHKLPKITYPFFIVGLKFLSILSDKLNRMKNKRLARYFFKVLDLAGFSLIELLTAVAIVGLLSVFGIKSYRTQINKAKSAEAKNSLSYVWSGQQTFKETWTVYHENLIAVNIIPIGVYNYDVGFGDGVTIEKNKLEDFPFSAALDVGECTNFYEICEGDCLTQSQAKFTSTTDKAYFGGGSNPFAVTTNCKVSVTCAASMDPCLKHCTGSGNSAKAKANVKDTSQDEFKAFATGKLKGDDVWSIDQKKTLEHIVDGI